MTHANPPLEVIDGSALTAIQGGGLFGVAWHAIDGAYHVGKAVVRDIKPVINEVKPVVKELAPIGTFGYRVHSIWSKLTK